MKIKLRKVIKIALSFLLIIIVSSCTFIKISVSNKRKPTQEQIVIKDNITLASTGAIKINKTHFFPASFQINTQNQTIFIDPIKVQTAEKADFIFITHHHSDHLSMPDIEKLLTPETIIIGSPKVIKKLSKLEQIKHALKPGDKLKLDGILCKAVPAYNTESMFLGLKAHPESKQNLGYILHLPGNVSIYHAGDTDYVPELNELQAVSVALIPIEGDNLTMNAEDAAELTNKINPGIVVPMHFELKDTVSMNVFISKIAKEIQIVRLDQ